MEYKGAIIGITDAGPKSLPAPLLERVYAAELLCGGERHLAFFPEARAERWVIRDNLSELVERLRMEVGRKRIVVLASGDPNFYGIGGYLSQRLPREWLEIFPNVTAVQLAFARLKEPWQDAVVVSVHGCSPGSLVETVRGCPKVAILTDDKNTPAAIARALLAAGVSNRRAVVCEHLDGVRERVVETTLAGLPQQEFSPLNVLILLEPVAKPVGQAPDGSLSWNLPRPEREREGVRVLERVLGDQTTLLPPRQAPTFGLPDHEFVHRDGMITKQEVRVISLAKLRLRENSIVWDIGAGSGSVTVEAARITCCGTVYAVERQTEAIGFIRENLRKFHIPNVRIVQALAPEGLEPLPDPDGVFIGGSSGRMREIIKASAKRLKPGGSMVVNAITLESVHEATAALKEQGFAVEVILVNIARSKELSGLLGFEALNPIYVISARREAET